MTVLRGLFCCNSILLLVLLLVLLLSRHEEVEGEKKMGSVGLIKNEGYRTKGGSSRLPRRNGSGVVLLRCRRLRYLALQHSILFAWYPDLSCLTSP